MASRDVNFNFRINPSEFRNSYQEALRELRQLNREITGRKGRMWWNDENLRGRYFIVLGRPMIVLGTTWDPMDDSVRVTFEDSKSERYGIRFTKRFLRSCDSLEEAIIMGRYRHEAKNQDPLHQQRQRHWAKVQVRGTEIAVGEDGQPVDITDMSVNDFKSLAEKFASGGIQEAEFRRMMESSKAVADAFYGMQQDIAMTVRTFYDMMSGAIDLEEIFVKYGKNRDNPVSDFPNFFSVKAAPAPRGYPDYPTYLERSGYAVTYYSNISDPGEIPDAIMFNPEMLGGVRPATQHEPIPGGSQIDAWLRVDELVDDDKLPYVVWRDGHPLAYRRNFGRGAWVENAPDARIPEGL